MSSARIGGLLVATGLAVPAITYFGAMNALAIDGMGGPPNQGAMVQAGFRIVGSLGVGVLMILSGIVILARSGRNTGRR